MRIEVLTAWHNEEALAPFFLNHYAFADRVRIIMGDDTTDRSGEICSAFDNAEIIPFNFPGGLLDDGIKIDKFNELIRTSDADWLIAVDADELVFARDETVRAFIARQAGYSVIWVRMWNVYRNAKEAFLDPTKPALAQRTHGNPVVHHVKPIVIRPAMDFTWKIGHHDYTPRIEAVECPEHLLAAHWAYADEAIACERYIRGRRDRFSRMNRRMNWGYQHFEASEKTIREECEGHINDPRIF